MQEIKIVTLEGFEGFQKCVVADFKMLTKRIRDLETAFVILICTQGILLTLLCLLGRVK